MMPSVSIIVPVYNKKNYLSDCTASLCSQSFTGFEIILVDDGSTDGSGMLADKLAAQDNRISVLHQRNRGVSAARNAGLQMARGEWIWFVDADDLPESGWLGKIKPLFEASCYDIICSDYNRIFPDGSAERVTAGLQGDIAPDALPDLFVRQQRTSGYFGYLWCKLIRRGFIEQCRASFEEGLTLAEDLKFMVTLYEQNPRCCFTQDIAMNYTVDAVNSSGNKRVDYQAQLVIRYKIYSWIRNTPCFDAHKAYLCAEISRFSAFVLFHGYEECRSVDPARAFFSEHPEYFECLSADGMSGILKTLVLLLQRRMYGTAGLVLAIRFHIRNLLRKVAHR